MKTIFPLLIVVFSLSSCSNADQREIAQLKKENLELLQKMSDQQEADLKSLQTAMDMAKDLNKELQTLRSLILVADTCVIDVSVSYADDLAPTVNEAAHKLARIDPILSKRLLLSTLGHGSTLQKVNGRWMTGRKEALKR